MIKFEFDIEKALNTVLYVLNKAGRCDFHKVFKILYFAEKEHLKVYGRPITADDYQAMQFGPVPSFIYDIFKAVRAGSHPFINADKYKELILVETSDKPYVTAKVHANTDDLSESEIIMLDRSILENQNLSFKALADKSHDSAWEKAFAKVDGDDEMQYDDIAMAAGANEEMVKYIRLLAENSSAKLA